MSVIITVVCTWAYTVSECSCQCGCIDCLHACKHVYICVPKNVYVLMHVYMFTDINVFLRLWAWCTWNGEVWMFIYLHICVYVHIISLDVFVYRHWMECLSISFLVLYSNTTNYHKLDSLKQHQMIISQCLWVENSGTAYLVICVECHEAAAKL